MYNQFEDSCYGTQTKRNTVFQTRLLGLNRLCPELVYQGLSPAQLAPKADNAFPVPNIWRENGRGGNVSYRERLLSLFQMTEQCLGMSIGGQMSQTLNVACLNESNDLSEAMRQLSHAQGHPSILLLDVKAHPFSGANLEQAKRQIDDKTTICLGTYTAYVILLLSLFENNSKDYWFVCPNDEYRYSYGSTCGVFPCLGSRDGALELVSVMNNDNYGSLAFMTTERAFLI